MPLAEARRVLTICTVCNYCNGFCETFRAAERRREFSDGDLVTLAHLCHNCGNCWTACQYAPPHALAVNVPKALAEVRRRSWRDRPWLALICVLLLPALTLALVPWNVLFERHTGPGAFYAVLPWPALTAIATLSLAFPAAVLILGIRRFWRESGGGSPWRAAPAALTDVLTLRNLRGGGLDCEHGAARRFFHHALAYGFLLCFAATAIATIYHHGLGWLAPYSLTSLPVLLGGVGGLGMIAGSAGLAWIKAKADPALEAGPKDYSFLALLFAVAFTGLCLLILRGTSAMGLLLAVHLGCVTGLFVTLPYGKFAHAPYRAFALLRAAMERRQKPGEKNA
jgi:citrate/tricarballylate utilization protein